MQKFFSLFQVSQKFSSKNKQAILVNDISAIIINDFLLAFWQLMNTPA